MVSLLNSGLQINWNPVKPVILQFRQKSLEVSKKNHKKPGILNYFYMSSNKNI